MLMASPQEDPRIWIEIDSTVGMNALYPKPPSKISPSLIFSFSCLKQNFFENTEKGGIHKWRTA